MPYLAVIALQVLCIVHVVKTGRPQLWIMALVFLPVASAIAYLIVEVLPGMQGNRHVRTARAKAVNLIDPERELRAARQALDLAETAANELRLADALAALGRHGEAIPHYRASIEKSAGIADARTQARLAAAMFETGDTEGALGLLDALEPASGQSEADTRALLRARILDQLGRKEEALSIYADIVTRMPGEEARCRYAALLLEEGWDGRALKVLVEVEGRMRHLSRAQRAADASMYRWASEKLAELQAR